MFTNQRGAKNSINFITIRGEKLEYQWIAEAKSNSPIIVFLHEGIGCVEMWKDFPSRLAAATGLGALAYSRVGYGRSDPVSLPRDAQYMHDEGIVLLPMLLAELDIKDAILFGHSDGGSIALINVGGTEGSVVKAIILEAPHVFIENKTVESISLLSEGYGKGPLKDRLERYHKSNVDCAFLGFTETWLNKDNARNWNIEKYVKNISKPVLLFQGSNDEFGTLEQVRRIQSQVKGVIDVVVIEDCGHSPHLEKPEMVISRSYQFLDSLGMTRDHHHSTDGI